MALAATRSAFLLDMMRAVTAASIVGIGVASSSEENAVSFPAQPEKRSRKQSYDALVLNVSAYGVDHEGMSFFVSWVGEVPAAAMRDPLLEDIFYTRVEQDLILTAKASGKGELSVASRSNITLGGFDGRQYVFNSASMMGVLRGYKVGQRFYTVGVFGDKSAFSAQRAVAFLDSFRLTGKKGEKQ